MTTIEEIRLAINRAHHSVYRSDMVEAADLIHAYIPKEIMEYSLESVDRLTERESTVFKLTNEEDKGIYFKIIRDRQSGLIHVEEVTPHLVIEYLPKTKT